MVNQKSQSLVEIAQHPYLVHMTGKTEAVGISETEYQGVLIALQNGERFAKVRDYLLMLNSIVLIEPRPVPPRPRPIQDFNEQGHYIKNQNELDEYDRLFGLSKLQVTSEYKE